MRRLFFGNFDFEAKLTRPTHRNDASLDQVLAELAPAWIAIARDGDLIWCPGPIEASFFQNLTHSGLARVQPISRLADIPRDCELVPWGWTDEIVKWAAIHGVTTVAPPLEAVRFVNSRRFSFQLEQKLASAPSGSEQVDTVGELIDAIDRLSAAERSWVVKAEFGNSSRERFFHRPGTTFNAARLSAWAERRLRLGQSLFVEPWLVRLEEVGIQLDIPFKGNPCLVGITGLLVDEAGRYRGSEFTPDLFDHAHWHPAVDAALEAGCAAQSAGYFGPMGIDAMRYQDTDGSVRLRPIQDVNARWTMGRLSLGFRHLLRPRERGFWWHGPRSALEALSNPVSKMDGVRKIVTTPTETGGRPTHLRSVLEFISQPKSR